MFNTLWKDIKEFIGIGLLKTKEVLKNAKPPDAPDLTEVVQKQHNKRKKPKKK